MSFKFELSQDVLIKAKNVKGKVTARFEYSIPAERAYLVDYTIGSHKAEERFKENELSEFQVKKGKSK